MADTDRVDLAEQNARGRVRMGDLKVKPGTGIVVETATDLHTFAAYAVANGMAPYSYRNRDGSWDTHGMVIALIKGLEVGLLPTQALQNIAVINNQPVIYGDAVPGLAFSTGQVAHFREYMVGTEMQDDWTAVCELRRKGMDNVLEVRFGVADAKKAGLWGKPKSPWLTYPGRMLVWRARSWAFRALFADALKGLGVYEEVIDVQSNVVDEEAPTVGQDGLLHQLRTRDPETGEDVPDDVGMTAEEAEALRKEAGV